MSALTQWEYLDLAYERAGQESKKDGGAPMEYHWHWEDTPSMEASVQNRLNDLGSDGWELVAAVSTVSNQHPDQHDTVPDKIVYYLKRQKGMDEKQSPYT